MALLPPPCPREEARRTSVRPGHGLLELRQVLPPAFRRPARVEQQHSVAEVELMPQHTLAQAVVAAGQRDPAHRARGVNMQASGWDAKSFPGRLWETRQ